MTIKSLNRKRSPESRVERHFLMERLAHVRIKLILLRRKKIKPLNMLIINVKEEESIDRALKRYKRKVNSTKIIKELRNRKNYTKPSVHRRNEVLSAEYRAKKFGTV